MPKCKYCKNSFSSKSVLNKHIKTAKYCLKLRNVKSDEKLRCEGCGKYSTTKYNFERHIQSCLQIKYLQEHVKKYTSEIDTLRQQNSELTSQNDLLEGIISELKDQVQNLQDKLENIALKAVSRSTVTNNKTQINNFLQNMQPITAEHFLEHTPQLTLEHIQKGASGYAEYALEHPLKDRVVCVDYSRRKIKFKNRDGDLVTDPEMKRLAPMFFDSIKAKSSEIVFAQNTPDMDSEMFEQVAKLFNTNADVRNAATGVKSEFYHDFVKHVCSGSVVE